MTATKLVPLDTPFIEFTCDTVGCERTDVDYIADGGETVALCPKCVKDYRGVSS